MEIPNECQDDGDAFLAIERQRLSQSAVQQYSTKVKN